MITIITYKYLIFMKIIYVNGSYKKINFFEILYNILYKYIKCIINIFTGLLINVIDFEVQ